MSIFILILLLTIVQPNSGILWGRERREHSPRYQLCYPEERCLDKISCGEAIKRAFQKYDMKIAPKILAWTLKNEPRCKRGVCCPFAGNFKTSERMVMPPGMSSKNGGTIKPTTIATTKNPPTTIMITSPPTTALSIIRPPVTEKTLQPDLKEFEKLRKHRNFNILAGPHCGFGLFPRISYGEEVAPGELPWIVMLRYRENNKLVFRCGGALISSRYVLTAAHCLSDPKNKKFNLTSVRLGETNLASLRDCVDDESEDALPKCTGPPQEIKVAAVIPHPDFKHNSILRGFPHDIGLVKLSHEAEISPFVMPICLAGLANREVHEFSNINMHQLSVAGWGMVDMKEDPTSEVLRRVNVSSVGNSECEMFYKRKLNTCQMCAGSGKGNACRGDSGGPLMAQAWSNKENNLCPLLLSVVSYGILDCGFESPTVFTNVTCYLEWILESVSNK